MKIRKVKEKKIKDNEDTKRHVVVLKQVVSIIYPLVMNVQWCWGHKLDTAYKTLNKTFKTRIKQ